MKSHRSERALAEVEHAGMMAAEPAPDVERTRHRHPDRDRGAHGGFYMSNNIIVPTMKLRNYVFCRWVKAKYRR